jgi:hypothetical protein
MYEIVRCIFLILSTVVLKFLWCNIYYWLHWIFNWFAKHFWNYCLSLLSINVWIISIYFLRLLISLEWWLNVTMSTSFWIHYETFDFLRIRQIKLAISLFFSLLFLLFSFDFLIIYLELLYLMFATAEVLLWFPSGLLDVVSGPNNFIHFSIVYVIR